MKSPLPSLPLAFAALLLAATMPSSASAGRAWGARPLPERVHPSRNWMRHFSSTPDVIANGSIEAAIEACDDRLGPRRYCVIEVGDGARLPVEIFRSRTKLVAAPGSGPLLAPRRGTAIYIGDDTRQVVIEGLDIEGHHAGRGEAFGIIVEGQRIRDIAILDNHIHDFDSDTNAHAIAVYGSGRNNSRGIRNVIIAGNRIDAMRTGSSEAIAVNGNVRRWEVRGNRIHDVNNIAIAAIGGEGTAPPRRAGRLGVVPGRLDAAALGFIEDNLVERMSTVDNPAYGKQESWAAAIYIDGAHHVRISGNQVFDTPWAFEIGAENCVIAQHITLTDNQASGSYYGDLVIGGYAERGFLTRQRGQRRIDCNPNNTRDANEGHGYVRHVTIRENRFESTDTVEEPITVQYRVTHALIVEPGVEAINDQGRGSARGDDNAIRIHD